MTVLVTGATGLLGGHVTELLAARGDRPRVLVRPGDRAPWPADAGIDVRWGDLRDGAAVRAAVEGVERVIHCAARTGPWGPAEEYEQTNVLALEGLVRAAMAAGAGRLVHVSSITVHGNDLRGEADEDAPLHEEPNCYSWSKIAGERLLERMIRDEAAPVTIVRPGWIYGPRDAASFARLASRIERGRMVVLGSGHNHLPLIYVGDAARGLLLAGASARAAGRTYLLVNDEPVTQADFLGAVASGLGAPSPTRRVPYGLALTAGAAAEHLWRGARRSTPPPVTRYGLQLLGGENRFVISRARLELDFTPEVGLSEGVRRSIEWYRGAYGSTGGAPADVRPVPA